MSQPTIDEILDEVERLDRKGTPKPWRWFTSCSYRRLSSDATGKDGDVLRGAIQRHDGQPDVVCSDADKELIAYFRGAAPALVAEVRRLRHDLSIADKQARSDSERFAKEREDLRAQIEDRRSRYRELAREAGYTGDTAEHSDVMTWAKDQKALVASLRAEVATYEALSNRIDELRQQELDKVVAAERARLVVPYRPGLPSVEQVRAHQKREPMGTWQMRYTEKQGWPEWRQFFALKAGSKSNGTPVEADCIGMQSSYGLLPLDPSGDPVECRPCTPNGTPLPWAEEGR